MNHNTAGPTPGASSYDGRPLLQAIERATGKSLKGTAPQYKANCPAHDDRNASLSVHVTTDGAKLNCHAECARDDILAKLDLTWRDLFPPRPAAPSNGPRRPWMPCMTDFKTKTSVPGHEVAREYEYTDPRNGGIVVRGVSRCVLKCFSQWRPDPSAKSGRRWNTKVDGVEVGHDLIYRAGELVDAIRQQRTVFVVEGEKDADRLYREGYPATCNPQGAGGWKAEHGSAWFTGADVVVIPDKDPAGRSHAADVVRSLIGVAASIEVVQAATGKDVSDHLDAGLCMWQLAIVAEPLTPSLLVPGCPECEVAA